MPGFAGLTAGDYYLSAAAPGYVEEFYEDSPDLAGAFPLMVTDDFSDSAFMTLAAEPQVSGTLTGPGERRWSSPTSRSTSTTRTSSSGTG